MTDELPKIRHKQFEYSPLVHGVYRGLWCAALPMPMLGMEVAVSYFLFLSFLGLGVRPILERTGLYRLISHVLVVIEEKADARFLQQRAQEIDRKMRDDRYRKRRLKHPDLPKHW